jgi:hypothetical protein
MSNILQILKEELEKAKSEKEGVGCLMLDMSKKIGNWKDVIKIIDPQDLYEDSTDDYGIEYEPHITVLYGFMPSIMASDIKNYLEDIEQNIKFKLIGIDIFPGGDKKPFDVVKFNIESEDLHTLHEECKKIPNKETFPDYKPHMTIAYVKKGKGEKYVKQFPKPMEMDGNAFMYSVGGKGSPKTKWKIAKKYKYSIELNEPKKLNERRLFEYNLLEDWQTKDTGDAQATNKVVNMINNNQFIHPTPQEFYSSLMQSKHKSMLTPYTPEELSKMKLFKLPGYNIGFALKNYNSNNDFSEIVAVHNNEPTVKGIGKPLVNASVKNGGKYLDHFDGYLSQLYKDNGFVEYKRDAYDPQYDEDGAFRNKYGKQDVVYRVHQTHLPNHQTQNQVN